MLASRVVAAALLLNDLSNLITCTFIFITCTACVRRHGNGSLRAFDFYLLISMESSDNSIPSETTPALA